MHLVCPGGFADKASGLFGITDFNSVRFGNQVVFYQYAAQTVSLAVSGDRALGEPELICNNSVALSGFPKIVDGCAAPEAFVPFGFDSLIVISDGVPEHAFDHYYPPASTRDTAAAVRKIMKRGTNVVAVALDDPDSFDCYTLLSDIYPNLIGCNDLNRLTSQLLGIIAKLLKA